MKFRCHNLNSLLLSGLMPGLLCGCSLKKDHKEAVHNIRNDIVLSDSIDMTSIRKDKETINIRETYDSLSGMIREKEISFVASSIDSQRDKVRRKDVFTEAYNDNVMEIKENRNTSLLLEKDILFFLSGLLLSLFVYFKFYYRK